ncbi:Uncharacterized protein APZ42_027596 [Daphnia magna]|uniref:Uncharacterized protein n=1 Tax=Daphnia magna TaxID=35525 RepID=A0A164R8D4_9CRUS|nr:Uncharacterized protein APZ42_027596 [Daphnia magna]
MKRKFSTLRVPVFTIGGKGLSPCFTMELPAFSSRNDRKIWITNTRSQRFSHSNWSYGYLTYTYRCNFDYINCIFGVPRSVEE